jgi:hypothetical protein
MVESYVVRAQKLVTMSASYGQVFRALPYLPGSQTIMSERSMNFIVDTDSK